MTLVVFQDIDSFTQLGCYALVEAIEGAANTRRGKLNDLLRQDGQGKILFRSASAGLQRCSCDLVRNKVAIITLTNKEWQVNRSLYDICLQSCEPISKIMLAVEEAREIAGTTIGYKPCTYCRVANVLQSVEF